MARSRTARYLSLVVALLFPAAARAGQGGTQYAFLVGCGKYLKTEFRELPYTGNDITGVRDALLATGFAPANVFALYDQTKEPQRYLPTRANILAELDLLLDGMRPADTLVVALSGHGVQFKGDPISYFVPIDGKVEDKKTLVALDGPGGLYEKLKSCKARKKLLVVNACRNDPTVSLDFARNKAELVDDDHDQVPAGIAAIYSCKAGQKSYYDPQRKMALFFEHFIKAWQGEYSSGGKVTLEQVFAEVTARTKADAHRVLRAAQVPQIRRDDLAGEWVVPPSALVTGRRLLQQGAPAQALGQLEKAVAVMPGNAAARVARGIAYVRTGQYAAALSDFREAARLEPDSADAPLQLGHIYLFGYGVTRPDDAEAVRQYRQAAARGQPEAMAKLGSLYAQGRGVAKEPGEAIKWYRKAADLRDPFGMVLLGEAYRTGNGVSRDEAEARQWYERAFRETRDSGDDRPLMMGNLGWMYENGVGVPKDGAEAVKWYQRAAQARDPFGMFSLGRMYEAGLGVPRDAAEAAKWYRQAADVGWWVAMRSVGRMYANGLGVARDQAEAVRWYRRAAERGDVPAMVSLGAGYELGSGVTRDSAEAIKWYRQAADAGERAGMFLLGRMYETGQGVARDEAEALRWYKKAAELGDLNAMRNVGVLYRDGRGVAKDDAEAFKWFKKAADAGLPLAMNSVGWSYQSGSGVARDDALAVQWFKKGAAAGEPFSMRNLAIMYETGRGVPRDRDEAIRWYRRAAEKGNDDARKDLKRLGAG